VRSLCVWVALDLTRARVLARAHAHARARELDKEGYQLIAGYLDACRLYVECLDVAYVSDREGLRDRLLRAPGRRNTTPN
jgi:hypothetical protein